MKKCVALCILKNKDNYLLIKRGKRKNSKEELSGKVIIDRREKGEIYE